MNNAEFVLVADNVHRSYIDSGKSLEILKGVNLKVRAANLLRLWVLPVPESLLCCTVWAVWMPSTAAPSPLAEKILLPCPKKKEPISETRSWALFINSTTFSRNLQPVKMSPCR